MANITKRPEFEVAVYDQKVKSRFLEVTSELTYNREIIFALQAIQGSPTLQKCDPKSIRHAVVNIALTGATLNPALQQAFLVPRKNKCCLDFSYRGLAHVAVSSGGVLDIDATVVYENDVFYYEMGLFPILKHVPVTEDRGEMRCVYATGVLPSGLKKFIVLNRKDIEDIRDSSMSYKMGSDSPWKGPFVAEMWRKSAVKRLYKLLPQTERMSTAIAVLNEHEGLDIKRGEKAQAVESRFEDTEENIDTISCPDTDSIVSTSECESCEKKKGCPAWEGGGQ